MPKGVSEFDVAGGRIGRPIMLVKGRVTGVPFPNDAELVYEGFMPSHEELTMVEGPFGEWPGYYTSSGPEPVLQVHEHRVGIAQAEDRRHPDRTGQECAHRPVPSFRADEPLRQHDKHGQGDRRGPSEAEHSEAHSVVGAEKCGAISRRFRYE